MSNTLPIALDISAHRGLGAYIRAVNAAPLLSAEQETALALRYREHNDLDAARELVMSQLRHVVRVARGFAGYGLPIADLIQEGNIGLMKAVKHYDPLRGVRLVSFAVHWIRAEIYDFVLRNWRIVKVATTKAQRKLFFNLRQSRKRLGWMKHDEISEMATNLDVPEEVVQEMEARMSHADVSFDGHEQDDDEDVPPAGYLPDMRYNPERLVSAAREENHEHGKLRTALTALDARSREIVSRRWLDEDKATLHELAAKYRVSAERIRQIEAGAFKKMRSALAA
jgi:RNA polymerase sigma-32 factor